MAENGSNAAIREALETFIKSVEWLCEGDERGRLKRQFGVLLSDARAAASSPPRNCDVGTPEEQAKRFAQHCDHYPQCMGCPFRKKMLYNCCEFRWSQSPYEEEGTSNG